MYLKIILLVIGIMSTGVTSADNTKLPIPRFASIKSNEVNARIGATIKSPIEWVFVRKGEPVEIVAEYEQWRQIRDIHREGGWVHSSVLSGKRSVIILGKGVVALTRSPSSDKIVAKVSGNVRCLLNKCKAQYCQINCQGHTGWLARSLLWGVYDTEYTN